MYTKVKTKKEIDAMRVAGKICSATLGKLLDNVKSGMSTKELAKIAKSEIEKSKGTPSFLGYQGFPDVICISVNDEVVHGIPKKEKIIAPGDIVSFDLGVTYDGMIVDSARSVLVESNDKVKAKLLKATKASLAAGVNTVKDGCTTGDIGSAVQAVLLAEEYGIVKDLVGHGVGHYVHEDPNIPNFGDAGTGTKLKAGMTIAIEPMATLGGEEVYIDTDQWTVKTMDMSMSAHFEQTILITKSGFEILTPFV